MQQVSCSRKRNPYLSGKRSTKQTVLNTSHPNDGRYSISTFPRYCYFENQIWRLRCASTTPALKAVFFTWRTYLVLLGRRTTFENYRLRRADYGSQYYSKSSTSHKFANDMSDTSQIDSFGRSNHFYSTSQPASPRYRRKPNEHRYLNRPRHYILVCLLCHHHPLRIRPETALLLLLLLTATTQCAASSGGKSTTRRTSLFFREYHMRPRGQGFDECLHTQEHTWV